MTERAAFDWLATGALFILIGAVAQAILASIAAVRGTDPWGGWPRVLAWGAIVAGSAATCAGAGKFAGWW